MPRYRKRNYRRKRPTRYRGRRYKKYQRKGPSTKVIKFTTGIPDRMMLKLKYAQSVQLVDAVGGVDQFYAFRGNSIWDPDRTGVGTQPLGRDQWVNFYNYYTVHGSKINVQILNQKSASTESTVIVSLSPQITDPAIGGITTNELPTYPYCKWVLLSGSASGNLPKYISSYMSTRKIFGEKDQLDDDYKSLQGTNPTNQWYWRIQSNNVDATNIFSVIMLVTITYYVEFQERVLLAPS